MRIVLKSGRVLGAADLVTVEARTDCTPVPASLEFQLVLSAEIDPELQEGAVVSYGDNYMDFVIVKRAIAPTMVIRDGQQRVLAAFIAVLKGFEKLLLATPKAVFLQDSSMAQALRAVGCTAKVVEDLPILKFFCPVGEIPTYEVARRCCEEAAAVCVDIESKIRVKRLSKMLEQTPIGSLAATEVQWIKNRAEENKALKSYQTVNEDGLTVEGTIKQGAAVEFYPQSDPRRLKNLSTMLMLRGTALKMLTPNMLAGEVIEIESKPYIILTAAHKTDTGLLGGASVTATKLWLADVVTV